MGCNKESIERRVATTVDDDLYGEFADGGKSKLVHKKVVAYYNRKGPQELAALNQLYEEMTPEQRKKPNR